MTRERRRRIEALLAARGGCTVENLGDHSKLGKTALMRCGHLGQWRGLITDRGLSPASQNALSQNALAKAGVNVILAHASVTTTSCTDENDPCDSP